MPLTGDSSTYSMPASTTMEMKWGAYTAVCTTRL